MHRFTDTQRDDFVDRVVNAATRRLTDNEQIDAVRDFIRRYFAHCPIHDLYDETPDNLFGAAFSHWRLASHRQPGVARVRTYNPRLDDHGWRCEHTIIEIVTDNMPFLVDSVSAEMNRRDLAVRLVIHPVLNVRRDADGRLVALPDTARNNETTDDGILEESFIHLQINRQPDEVLGALTRAVQSVLGDVRAAVDDWSSLCAKAEQILAELPSADAMNADPHVEEAREFLHWLAENNFTFLGYRAYAFEQQNGDVTAEIASDSGLGILRDPNFLVFDDLRSGAPMPPPVRAFVERPDLIMVTKANRVSTVHRPVHMDTIVVKRFGDGQVIGEHIIVGLFAAAAYNRSIRSIPLLRRKLIALFARTGFKPRSHDGRALTNIVENYPRDELFQVSEDHLFHTALGILDLQQRQRVALFIRRDDFERYIATLIYIPRDRFNTQIRIRIQRILEKAFDGTVTAQYSQVGDAPLARLQMYVRTVPGEIPDYDADQIEAAIVEATRTWSDGLRAALIAIHGEEQGHALFGIYGDAFPPGYQDHFIAEEAVADIEKIEQTLARQDLSLTLYRPLDGPDNRMRFKIFQPDSSIILSTIVPMLEDLGLRVVDEVPHVVKPKMLKSRRDGGGRIVMVHDFGVETRSGSGIDIGAVRDRFHEAFLAVWNGMVESDRFNSLVLEGGLTCWGVVVIRAYSKYLRQAGIAFSEAYMQQTMTRHAGLACAVVRLFTTLFDPARSETAEADAARIRTGLATGLDAVASADEDRIIRRFINAVEGTLRTNYFQTTHDGGRKPYLSFKIDSRSIEELPLPRPMMEVFVYSPRMEGVHLRGGKVARGGIRWSDRREDFRTEVLGLMKAQQVKNAVIVPVGAKGGFVLKKAPEPGDREAFLAEGVACYTTLIQGLLDITDNQIKGETVAPAALIRRDGDDSYLVVAADKGTATFSDIANRIAAGHGFWLGDAFASGGSQGYDHKKMGITARGAWESVKRHFREMGRNIQEEDFTVIGIGDMSGDVFGNGMLLSRHIKMIAAFNHQHIFIDPDPDPEASFLERKRVFELPRSTWRDYDSTLISEGGAVFERRAKSIVLTPEIKRRFGITADRMTPNELVHTLLKAEVDLMWFGGIGTFIKSSHETHAAVGDRANDVVRVDADDLRCHVIGEGANLGITQLGRIQFARAGGRINTDFIDNSAGVDCSDHEVNIKILLDAAVADGDMTGKQRNVLLGEMTDEVAALVLRDNYLQSQAISLIADEGFGALENQARLIRMLERQGRLNREVEALPDEEALAERMAARQGLSRPEIAVMFSHCKIWLYDEVLDSDLPDDRHLAEDVERYFPLAIQERFPGRIAVHRLRRELISTAITNSLINRVGGTFVTEIRDKTGMSAADITRAYIIARDVFSARAAWEEIEALDNKIPAEVQTGLHREVQRMIERATMWFLRNGGSPIDITVNVQAFTTAVSALGSKISAVLPEDLNGRILARAERYRSVGVPDALAARIAYMIVLPSACDIVRIAAARGISMDEVAGLYFTVGEYLGFGWLRNQAETLNATTHWQKLAVAAIVEELYGHQRDLTVRVLDTVGKMDTGAVEQWAETCRPAVDRMRMLMGELEAATPIDLSMLTVASRQLGTLTQS
jgi:glutamate dehydrogenase